MAMPIRIFEYLSNKKVGGEGHIGGGKTINRTQTKTCVYSIWSYKD
jgi:hypothetical protein